MNKKLLTVAIGAALAAAPMLAAQADVKVYGRAQVEVATVEVGGTGTAASNNIAAHNTVTQGTDRTIANDTGMGRFGIVADEDLGGGMKAVALFEYAANTASGVAPSSRENYVGLEHKAAGSLQLGRFNSPYLNSGVALDPFVATLLEARNNMGMTGNADGIGVLNGHSSFLSDGLRYSSPTMAGIQAVVYLGVDGTGAAATCGTANGVATGGGAGNVCTQGAATNGDISASLGWKGGPANVFVAYNKMANVAKTATVSPEPTSMKVGGQFKFGTSTISAQYEMIDRSSGAAAATGGDEASVLFLGYQLALGSTTIAAQLGQTKNDQANLAEKEGTYYAVGAIHNFSKTARVFGGFRSTSLEDSAATNNVYRDETVISLGMRKDF